MPNSEELQPIRGFGPQDRLEWKNKIQVTEPNIIGTRLYHDDDDDKRQILQM